MSQLRWCAQCAMCGEFDCHTKGSVRQLPVAAASSGTRGERSRLFEFTQWLRNAVERLCTGFVYPSNGTNEYKKNRTQQINSRCTLHVAPKRKARENRQTLPINYEFIT